MFRLIVIFCFFMTGGLFTSISGQDCDVEGAWEVIDLTFTDKDGKVNVIEIGNPPGLKILSKNHWVFVEMTGQESNPTSGGGGTYTVDGSKYTEIVSYHAAEAFIGQTITFDCKVTGDKWFQSGYLPGGTFLEETYRRAQK